MTVDMYRVPMLETADVVDPYLRITRAEGSTNEFAYVAALAVGGTSQPTKFVTSAAVSYGADDPLHRPTPNPAMPSAPPRSTHARNDSLTAFQSNAPTLNGRTIPPPSSCTFCPLALACIVAETAICEPFYFFLWCQNPNFYVLYLETGIRTCPENVNMVDSTAGRLIV